MKSVLCVSYMYIKAGLCVEINITSVLELEVLHDYISSETQFVGTGSFSAIFNLDCMDRHLTSNLLAKFQSQIYIMTVHYFSIG